ncbi:nitrous oxide reductase family maturation protein NosD [Chloroflexota bacterium]
MKKKFSRILGVGLSLALLTSLLLTAAPVSANVGQATVDVSPDEISLVGKYVINFTVNNDLTADDDTITVRFPDDTVVPTGALTITTDFTIAASPGWVAGVWQTGFSSTNITAMGDEDDRTVVFDLDCATTANGEIGETATVRIEFTTAAGIINPTDPGTYTLEVKTSDETTYVESEAYDIDAPVVGGFVYVYNPSDILMATFGGSAALNDAEAPTDYYAKEGFTVKVGPGTYTLTGDVTISGKGVTLESSEGAADTIIDADGNSILITGEDVVIDDFTIDDADEAIIIQQDDATVKNCVITDATAAGIRIDGDGTAPDGTDATISDNVIEDCAIGIHVNATGATDYGDVDITGNEITETSGNGGIVLEDGSTDIDITGNTITGNDNSGIYFADGPVACDDILIQGNTISENVDHGIELANATAAPINIAIRENDILDNEADGIFITGANSWSATLDYIMFNNIYGNDDAEIDNDSGGGVIGRFNWWGTAVEADFEDELEGLVDADYEPFLKGTQETTFSGSKVVLDGETGIDAKDAASVKISGVEDTTNTLEAAIISAAKYGANPQDALADAIGFYDVYVLLETGFDITDVTAKVKFYDDAITTGSTASFWTGDFWAECSDIEARSGIIYVTISDDTLPALDELEETMFAVTAGEAVEDVFAAPAILAPATGADDVSLTPTFAWAPVADADGYYFQLADNPNFVVPMVKLDGDAGRLIVTAYNYVTALPYSTPYYWRVKAVSGTEGAGTLEESDWTTSVFITMPEPEEAMPPVVIEEAPPAAPAPIIKPIVEVITPAAEMITPVWIYVVIGVGAIMIIAVIVLIVRTRRVA